MIIHDAATTFITVIDTAFTWVETLAAAVVFVVCVIGLTAAPLFAPTTRRGIRRPNPAARRPVPSWAHTEPYDYDAAAWPRHTTTRRTTVTERITELDLDLIERRAKHLYEYPMDLPADADILTGEEVPALVDEVRRLRARVAELEGKQPARCGRTRDFRGSEHGSCVRQAGHWTAYCRDAEGSEFIAVAVDQPQPTAPAARSAAV